MHIEDTSTQEKLLPTSEDCRKAEIVMSCKAEIAHVRHVTMYTVRFKNKFTFACCMVIEGALCTTFYNSQFIKFSFRGWINGTVFQIMVTIKFISTA